MSSISPIRITGLTSGLDTESVVKSLMEVEQLKVNRVIREKTSLEWKNDAEREINSLISEFKSENLSALNADRNLTAPSFFNNFNVVNLGAANYASITPRTGASTGQVTIDSVTQLATAASVSSVSTLTGGELLSRSIALGDLSMTIPLSFGGANNDEISFKINDMSFTFKSTDSLQTMLNKINASTAGVSIQYSELTNKLTLTSKSTGSDSAVKIENVTGNAFGAGSAFGIADGTYQNGQDAILSINDTQVIRSSNQFTIDNITYNLYGTSSSAANFSISRNVDATVEKIKTFINAYNKLVKTLTEKINEQSDNDYYPLTDSEKEAMSDSEIERWEQKAKAGQMGDDQQLSGLLTKIRSLFYITNADSTLRLSDIGLRTGSYTDGGQITIDENDLHEALANDPDQVARLFTASSTAADKTTKYEESGFAQRLVTVLGEYTGTFSETTANQQVSKLAQKIKDLNEALSDKEETYYQKFSAMETALARLQSQSSYLSSFFASSNSSST